MRLRVTSGGRITIPEPLRRFLGIRPGTLLEFSIDKKRRIAVVSRANGKPWVRRFGRRKAG